MLSRNIGLNGLRERVRPVNAVVGRQPGTVQFSIGLGTENHVADTTETASSQLTQMTTLDAELADTPAVLLKVDVEGFETEVFAGAEKTLQNPALQAIIVERNGCGNRYGYDEEKLHAQIRSQGFSPFIYEPFGRRMLPIPENSNSNIVYIRDLKAANERLRTAPAFELGGKKI
jgi:FkbM family methyltransferase